MTIDHDGRRLSYGGGSTSWIIIIARDELQLGLASYATQYCVEKEVIALGTITSMTHDANPMACRNAVTNYPGLS